MDTPSTPDYTLDMPNKRWTGQVRAWRRALHKYDPADLRTAFTEAKESEQQNVMDIVDDDDDDKTKSVQELQLEQAKAAGLPVQFESNNTPKPSPTSVVGAESSNLFDELDQWEDKRKSNDNFDDFVSAGGDMSDESDDDLL